MRKGSKKPCTPVTYSIGRMKMTQYKIILWALFAVGTIDGFHCHSESSQDRSNEEHGLRSDREESKKVEKTEKDDQETTKMDSIIERDPSIMMSQANCPVEVKRRKSIGPITLGMSIDDIATIIAERGVDNNENKNRIKYTIEDECRPAGCLPGFLVVGDMYELKLDKEEKVASVSVVVNKVPQSCLIIEGERVEEPITIRKIGNLAKKCSKYEYGMGGNWMQCDDGLLIIKDYTYYKTKKRQVELEIGVEGRWEPFAGDRRGLLGRILQKSEQIK